MKQLKSTIQVITLCVLVAWVGGCARSRHSCSECQSGHGSSFAGATTSDYESYHKDTTLNSSQGYQPQGDYQPPQGGSGTRNTPSYGGSGSR